MTAWHLVHTHLAKVIEADTATVKVLVFLCGLHLHSLLLLLHRKQYKGRSVGEA